MTKEITAREEAFLEALFDEEANPDMCPQIAKDLAGIPKSVAVTKLMRSVKSKLQDDTQNYFLAASPRAARTIVKMANDGNPIPGSEKVLAAAMQILDRAGVTKKEKQEVEIKIPIGVVMLPPIDIPDEQINQTHQIECPPTAQVRDGEVATEAHI